MPQTDDGRPVKVEDRTNGQVVKSQPALVTRRRHPPRRTWKKWLVNNTIRLGVWYTILVLFFQCPSTSESLNSQTPRVCKQYFSARAHIQPYVQPYYDAYASPYVEKAQPYIRVANDRVVWPAASSMHRQYTRFAAPQVAKASTYAQEQWRLHGLPRFRRAQESAQQAYDENLAPQVLKVSEVATPYYESAKENAINAHEKHIIPAIAYSQPHLYRAYALLQKFVLEKALPLVQHAWTRLLIFVDGTVWPFIGKVYGENVRPQLVMIGERIVKYQEGRKLQSAMDQVDKSFEQTASSEIPTSVQENISSTTSSTTSSTSPTTASSTATPSESQRIATDQTISDDLVKWQKKFAVAADTGTEDLRERIEELIASLSKEGLDQGTGLGNALGKSSELQLDTIKAKIKSVVLLLPEEVSPSEVAAAESEITKAIHEAGSEIKTRATAVRTWHEKYRQDLKQRSELATESTLHVLDDIRDLGLQEIGLRWAWMEGVTYRHWQKYHELKKRFADWRSEAQNAALSHPALLNALDEADKRWEESMGVTENAAKELIRLKDVAKWKIAARDSTDNFDSRAVPMAAAAVSSASSMVSGLKEALIGSSQGTIESFSSVASGSIAAAGQSMSVVAVDGQDSAVSLLSEATSAVSPSSVGTAEAVVQQVSSSASSVASLASSAFGDATSSVTSITQSSSADTLESIVFDLSGEAGSVAASIPARLDEELGSASSLASSMISSATTEPFKAPSSSAVSMADSVSSSASSAVAASDASQSMLDAIKEAGERATDLTSSWMSA